MKKRFIIEIEVDENTIADKYPNYRFNYRSVDEFIKSEILCSVTNETSDPIEKWGYVKRLIGDA